MLRSIIVGADTSLAQRLEAAFLETGRFGLVRALDTYPAGPELERLVRAHAPQAVFICTHSLEDAVRLRTELEETVAGMPVIAFGQDAGSETLMELMKSGIREYLSFPIQIHELLDVSDRIEDQLTRNPLTIESTDLMFSFLPAKPGVGTSTLALNVAVALSRLPGNKALLADFDLNSGLIAFMLKLNNPYSIVDAALRSEELDENLWPQLVSPVEELDVLPCGRPDPGVRIQPLQIQRMVQYARRHYGVICADLSGNMEKYALEIMQESKKVFLVTTPEIPPLHLARERLSFLHHIQLGDRVTVLLNRWNKRSTISVSQIEDLLEVPVYETIPNSYTEVHAALVAGKPIDTKSDLGKCFSHLARRIMNVEADAPKKTPRRFLETFSILPQKYSLSRNS